MARRSHERQQINAHDLPGACIPVVGNPEMQPVNPRMVDPLIRKLQRTESFGYRNRVPCTQYLSPSNIVKILTLLKSAFNHRILPARSRWWSVDGSICGMLWIRHVSGHSA